MHNHQIDWELPFELGRIKARIDHRPLDAENLLIIVHIETLPKIFKSLLAFAPKKAKAALNAPIEYVMKRDTVRLWCGQGTAWANEPAEGQPSE